MIIFVKMFNKKIDSENIYNQIAWINHLFLLCKKAARIRTAPLTISFSKYSKRRLAFIHNK